MVGWFQSRNGRYGKEKFRVLSLSQRYCWRCRCSGMLYCVVSASVVRVLEDTTIFRNVGKYSPRDTASCVRTSDSSKGKFLVFKREIFVLRRGNFWSSRGKFLLFKREIFVLQERNFCSSRGKFLFFKREIFAPSQIQVPISGSSKLDPSHFLINGLSCLAESLNR